MLDNAAGVRGFYSKQADSGTDRQVGRQSQSSAVAAFYN